MHDRGAALDFLGRTAEAMLAVDNPEQRFAILSAALARLGVDQINYGYFDPAAASRAEASVLFLSTMQTGWLDYYYDRELHLTDPHVKVVREGNRLPYRWGDRANALLEDSAQRRTALETGEAGLHSALCVPLCLPGRPDVPVAGMTLGSSLPEAELRRLIAGLEPQLVALAHLYHNSTIATVTRTRLGLGDLSPRERDVLTGLARGWRQARIADELGISVSAVEQYLANARRKLRAASNTEAVAKAMLYQVIAL